jgi:excisionase family DNA binding protein
MSNHSQNPKPLRLLTPQETAAFLSVSVRTVQRLVSAGDLHAVRISKSMRFRMDDLLHFVDRNDWS